MNTEQTSKNIFMYYKKDSANISLILADAVEVYPNKLSETEDILSEN